MLKKKIAFVGTDGLPARYGGFETMLANFFSHISSKEFEYVVYSSSKGRDEFCEGDENFHSSYVAISANGPASILYDAVCILKAAVDRTSVLVLFGVSGAIVLPIFKPFFKKVIVNIDGLEWRRAKWGPVSKAVLWISELICRIFADVLILDNKALAGHMWSLGEHKARFIAYGNDHATPSSEQNAAVAAIPFNKYLFSVCRVEPENNVHLILQAVSELEKVNLVFVGNWKNSEYGRNLRDRYQHLVNFQLLDPVYDIDVLNGYRTGAHGFLHGHSAGGTNPSLVEYMAFSKQVLAFDCDFNRVTTNNLCQYFADTGSLKQLIVALWSSSSENKALKTFADENYSWGHVVKSYESLWS